MGFKTINCIGFHGTESENADSILFMNKFYNSCDDEEWLGTGIYFFRDDKKQAKLYCKAKGYSKPKILQANISSDKAFDLLDTESYELFCEYAHKLKDKYNNRKDYRERKLMNSVILNTLYNIKPYDVVIGAFEVPYMKCAQRTNTLPIHIQICVKSHDCISSIKEA